MSSVTTHTLGAERAARRRAGHVWLAIAALTAVAVPGLLYANAILNHFYLQGAYFWDTGVVAGVIWRRDMWLTYPPLWPIGSLYAYHIMPLLSVLTAVSHWLPVSLPRWFAMVSGVGHALPAAAVFWLLAEGVGLRSGIGLAAAVALAIACAFTGIPLATILFPHPEILLAGGLVMVFAAIALERYHIAAACLAFALLVREDAGFHAFGLIALLVIANRRRGRSWREQQPLLMLASIGFLYSASAVAVKQFAVAGQLPLFIHDYVGDPPFRNVTLQAVLLNVIGLPVYRAYVVWPAAAAVAWALWSRNGLIALGYLAFCPWLVLHLLANRDILQTLSGYYSFPFLVALAWPLAAVVIDARQRGVRPDARATLAPFAAMVALSFMGLSHLWNPGGMDLWRNFTTIPSPVREQATDRAVQLLLSYQQTGSASPLGVIFTDQSVYSLAPYALDASAVVRPIERAAPVRGEPVDTLAYFASGADFARIRDHRSLAGLTHRYRFKATALHLVTNRDLDGVAGLERQTAE